MGVPMGDLIVETEAGLAFDSRVILLEITVPILLIAGDRDQFFPRSVIEETAALIPNCTLIVHEDQGHMEVASDPRAAQAGSDVLVDLAFAFLPALAPGPALVRGQDTDSAARSSPSMAGRRHARKTAIPG